MNTFYITNATFLTNSGKKKSKKQKGEIDKIHGKCKCFTIRENCKTMKGRCEAQNYIRAYIYTILDCYNSKMDKEEAEIWKQMLWNMSEQCENFYLKQHKLNVWSH